MKSAGFLIFDDLEELDLVGPWEMFGMWNLEAGGPKCFTVAETSSPVRCVKGLNLIADYTFSNCPGMDILIVPGGKGTRQEINNDNLINFIKKCATECKYLISVCTGAFLLEKAGLLKGKKATTHWESHERLKSIPDVIFQPSRWTQDGNIWTAAGISAGIDMSLAFINHVAGEDAAAKVQLYSEYFPDTKAYLPNQELLSSLPAAIKNHYDNQ